jgi:hypothetical protein
MLNLTLLMLSIYPLSSCDPNNPALSDDPINFPVKRYRLVLSRLDGYAAESSFDPNLIYQVALFRAAVHVRLSSTDQFVRTMYIRYVLRTRESSISCASLLLIAA